MLQRSPSSKTVLDFKFSEFCKLKLFVGNVSYDRPANLVAVSPKYGLEFAGGPNCINAVPIHAIIQIVAQNNIKELESFPRRKISIGYPVTHLEVNLEQELLAVIFIMNDCPIVRIYDVKSFLTENICILHEAVVCSNPGSCVIDLCWNPGVGHMLACCNSDGSVLIFEFNQGTYKINSLPKESMSTCLCWSPKGKQIVIGNRRGNLTQYLPELKAVKNLQPPSAGGLASVISVKWVSNFQFFTAYNFQNNQSEPCLVVVNTTKNAVISYVSYEDVCLLSGNQRPLQYYMIHHNIWNMLFVGASNSTEIGVLATDGTNWTQFILDDEGRAELPPNDREDTYPIGMTMDNVSQIVVSGRMKPLPLFSMLSTDGLLYIYTVDNSIPETAQLPPFEPTVLTESILSSYFPREGIVSSQVTEECSLVVDTTTDTTCEKTQREGSQEEYAVEEAPDSPELPPKQVEEASFLVETLQLEQPKMMEPAPKYKDSHQSLIPKVDYLKEMQERMVKFEEEVREIRMLVDGLKLDNKRSKEAASQRDVLCKMDGACKRMVRETTSLKRNIEDCKLRLIEACACVQDAKTRHLQLAHPGYNDLVEIQGIDPLTASVMKSIGEQWYYLETQAKSASILLDDVWLSHREKNASGLDNVTSTHIPKLEYVYQTIVLHARMMDRLRAKVGVLEKRMREIKRRYVKVRILSSDPIFNLSFPSFNEEEKSVFCGEMFDLSENLLGLKFQPESPDAKSIADRCAKAKALHFHIPLRKRCQLVELLADHQVRRVTVENQHFEEKNEADYNETAAADVVKVESVEVAKKEELDIPNAKLEVKLEPFLKKESRIPSSTPLKVMAAKNETLNISVVLPPKTQSVADTSATFNVPVFSSKTTIKPTALNFPPVASIFNPSANCFEKQFPKKEEAKEENNKTGSDFSVGFAVLPDAKPKVTISSTASIGTSLFGSISTSSPNLLSKSAEKPSKEELKSDEKMGENSKSAVEMVAVEKENKTLFGIGEMTATTTASLFGQPFFASLFTEANKQDAIKTNVPKTAVLFDQPVMTSATTTAAATTVVTTAAVTTTTSGGGSMLSQMLFAPTTESKSLFGQHLDSVTATSVTTSSSSAPLFSQPITTVASSLFGQPVFGAPSTTSSIFGSSSTGMFGQLSITPVSADNPAKTTASNVFGFLQPQFAPPATTTTASLFGQPIATSSTGLFGQPTTTATTLFGQPTTTTVSSLFGLPATSSSVFGQSVTTTTSLFGTQTSTPAPGLFGQTVSAPFGTTTPTTPSTGVFGGEPLFGKPAFGGGATFGGTPFGQASTSSFGSSQSTQPTFGSSSFGSGFGVGFQQTTPTQSIFGGSAFPKSTPAFGSSPSFGAPPTFGSPATFGAPPTFGSTPTKLFGQTAATSTFASAAQQSAPFANMATDDTMSFGNLAQQQTPAFGGATFGSPATVFGNADQKKSFGSPSFGGSSFSSWR